MAFLIPLLEARPGITFTRSSAADSAVIKCEGLFQVFSLASYEASRSPLYFNVLSIPPLPK